jgi:hypothetical protein
MRIRDSRRRHVYSHAQMTPNASFSQLVMMRMAQVSGLAFLFAPLTTVASANISREDNGDATSPFTMARNVSGSIGVSAATALVVERTPARMVHLAPHMTPLDQGYAVSPQQYEQLVWRILEDSRSRGWPCYSRSSAARRGKHPIPEILLKGHFCPSRPRAAGNAL